MFDDSTEFKSICQLADLLNRLKKNNVFRRFILSVLDFIPTCINSVSFLL